MHTSFLMLFFFHIIFITAVGSGLRSKGTLSHSLLTAKHDTNQWVCNKRTWLARVLVPRKKPLNTWDSSAYQVSFPCWQYHVMTATLPCWEEHTTCFGTLPDFAPCVSLGCFGLASFCYNKTVTVKHNAFLSCVSHSSNFPNLMGSWEPPNVVVNW